MNALLLCAAALSAAIAIAHSYLGERYILIRLFRRSDLPHLFGSDQFTRRTLRFAWHLTSVAWLGFAVLFAVGGGAPVLPQPATATVLLRVAAVTFAVTALVTLVGSRGRHPAWPIFAAIALVSWLGTA